PSEPALFCPSAECLCRHALAWIAMNGAWITPIIVAKSAGASFTAWRSIRACNPSCRVRPVASGPMREGFISPGCGLATGRRLQKCAFPKFLVSLLELGLSVHHDWTVAGDRFLERLARVMQPANAVCAGLQYAFVRAVNSNKYV